jgi:hypothetical protein
LLLMQHMPKQLVPLRQAATSHRQHTDRFKRWCPRHGVREGLDATVERIRLMHGLQRVLPALEAHEARQAAEQRVHEAACAAVVVRRCACAGRVGC